MNVIEVTTATFEQEVLQANVPVLVDFNANWCGPCRMLKPLLEEIADARSDCKVVSVNIDDEDELAEEYEVSSIPCVVLFKNGAEVERSIGFKPREEIEKMLGE